MKTTDHRKDGTFRRGHKAASKGEPRRMWSGRLPERTHGKLRSLVAGGAHDSQADAIAAAVDRLANVRGEQRDEPSYTNHGRAT
jgi:hypothetical protein